MPERRTGDVVRVEERVVRALGLLPPEEPAVLGGREGLAQRRAKGVHVGELARRGGRKAHEVLGPRGAAGSESDHAARDILITGSRAGVGRGDPSACFVRSPSDGAPV